MKAPDVEALKLLVASEAAKLSEHVPEELSALPLEDRAGCIARHLETFALRMVEEAGPHVGLRDMLAGTAMWTSFPVVAESWGSLRAEAGAILEGDPEDMAELRKGFRAAARLAYMMADAMIEERSA